MDKKYYFVYILTNRTNKVLYTGVTNNLQRRVVEHSKKEKFSFTAKYKVDKLVYYEQFFNPYSAIEREKQLKAGSRVKKIRLINSKNPEWKNLYDELFSTY